MISLLLAILLTLPTVEEIESLKEKEEKAWVSDQKQELAALKEEKKRLQEEIRYQKEELQRLCLDILDKKAKGTDLFTIQMEIQHNLYLLQTIEDEISSIQHRIHRGLFGELLARKKHSEENFSTSL